MRSNMVLTSLAARYIIYLTEFQVAAKGPCYLPKEKCGVTAVKHPIEPCLSSGLRPLH